MLHLDIITTESCGCCHDFIKIVNDVKQGFEELEYEEVPMSKYPQKEIKGLPYTIIYKDGKEVGEILGCVRMNILISELQKYVNMKEN